MNSFQRNFSAALISGFFLFVCPLAAQDPGASGAIGRWDLEIQYGEAWVPSWLEVKLSGNKALVGYFVGPGGSARPISEVFDKGGLISFSIPPQWSGTHYMHLTGTVNEDRMEGNLLDHMGHSRAFRGTRAPSLLYPAPVSWSEPRALLNENSLEGWVPQLARGMENQWFVKDGVLTSPASGVNLMTEEKFMDFKLHIEFRYPEHSNSGVYLRGRYEVQVEDSYGKEPASIYLGGVYGFLTPSANVAKKPGEWQSYDITLIGRRVTVVANGETIIHNQIIPGITGGALDSREGEPGPIYLQGDHGPVEYRNITISEPEN
ncbi:3-keto-disaccharide hydrolase [Robiginitalea marina]|uniref:DUF1080 domain-containing protein n=1 Tax=Robiginitalea marina TaxID=2954105 RepID=A0ABT1B136_9FLAO|nr:DUF1080 domain-containing protein [Robiginitalea marina]MCO5725577.1 DUF1080 domain-containing protein [Robiginitalea marina]